MLGAEICQKWAPAFIIYTLNNSIAILIILNKNIKKKIF